MMPADTVLLTLPIRPPSSSPRIDFPDTFCSQLTYKIPGSGQAVVVGVDGVVGVGCHHVAWVHVLFR